MSESNSLIADRIRLVVGIACVILTGIAIGMIISGGRPIDRAVRIEPRLVKPNQPAIENTTVEASFELVNGSTAPLIVKEARGTCGCMGIETEKGPLSSPITLAAGAKLPWRVRISTQGKSGPEEHGLQILCEQNGKPLSVSTVVSMVIQPSWHFFPPLVQIDDASPQSTVTAEIGLYCGADLPFESLAPPRVTPNNAAEVEWIDEPSTGSIPELIDVREAPAKRRRVLKVSMRAGDAGTVNNLRIDLPSKDQNGTVASASMICRSIREPYELIPPVVIVSSSSVEEFVHQVVRCRFNRGASGPLRIGKCPDHIQVALKEIDRENWDIHLIKCPIVDRLQLTLQNLEPFRPQRWATAIDVVLHKMHDHGIVQEPTRS